MEFFYFVVVMLAVLFPKTVGAWLADVRVGYNKAMADYQDKMESGR